MKNSKILDLLKIKEHKYEISHNNNHVGFLEVFSKWHSLIIIKQEFCAEFYPFIKAALHTIKLNDSLHLGEAITYEVSLAINNDL